MLLLLLLVVVFSGLGLGLVHGGSGNLRQQQQRESLVGITNYASVLQESFDRPWDSLAGASCPSGTSTNSIVIPSGYSQRMVASGFNFSVPDFSNISAIQVHWGVSLGLARTPRLHEIEASLFADGGSNLSSVLWYTQPIAYSGSEGWNTTVGLVSYPQSGNDPLWGTQWTARAINSALFGCTLRVTNPAATNVVARIHCIDIVVDYFPPAPPPSSSTTTTGSTTGITSGTTVTTGETTALSGTSMPLVTTTMFVTTVGTSSSPSPSSTATSGSITGAFTLSTAVSSQSTVDGGDTPTSSLDSISVLVLVVVMTLVACVSASVALYAVFRLRSSSCRGKSTLEEYELAPGTCLEPEDLVLSNVVIEEGLLFSGESLNMHKAVWQETTDVACQCIDDDLGVVPGRGSLLRTLRHDNIAHTYGIFYSDPQLETETVRSGYIVMEFVSDVLLSNFLEDQLGVSVELLLALAMNISSAMSFLESKRLVYGILTVSKVAIVKKSEGYVAKLVDLNIVGCLPEGSDVHLASAPPPQILHRWCAPETLEGNIYSSKSDVWSFMVLVWQTFVQGQKPYLHLTDDRVKDWICAGSRIPDVPYDCPNALNQLMNTCWSRGPSDRPGFQEIHKTIKEIRNALPPSITGGDTDMVIYATMSAFSIGDDDEEEEEDDDDDDDDDDGGGGGGDSAVSMPLSDANKVSSFYASTPADTFLSPADERECDLTGGEYQNGSAKGGDTDEADMITEPVQDEEETETRTDTQKKKKKKKKKKKIRNKK